MKRTLIILALLLAALPAAARERPPERGPERGYANPSAVIAAEIAFARLAQEKGQWTAFAKTAAKDAELFMPLRTNALAWLKGRKNPPVSVRWQPHQVWMSKDGSLAVSHGAWQGPQGQSPQAEGGGWFVTVWRAQEKGGYKWVLDQFDTLPQPLPAPDMLAAHVADPGKRPGLVFGGCRSSGGEPVIVQASDDGTLQACTVLFPDGRRQIGIFLQRGDDWETVLSQPVAAPPPPAPTP